jgi:hypothetical protein
MVITLKQPSSLIHEIRIEKVGNWNLFKFSDSLQIRMETLLDKKKADQLTPEEVGELDAIGELDRIFTHINAMIAATSAKENAVENTVAVQPRQFGCGKGIFTYVADDFDATPPGFEEYMQK